MLEYPWGREYVPPGVISSSADQLRGLPLTLEHPPERRVDAQTWGARAVGHAGDDAHIDDDAQSVTLYVQRSDAVQAVERGTHHQISMGYDVELDATPGTTPDGQRYDSVQQARAYNHIALVRQARGGSTLALRLDSAGDAEIPPPGGLEDNMKIKIRLDGIDHELEAGETTQQALTRALAAADETKARLDAATVELEVARGERDQLKIRLDEANDPARLDARVKARGDLEAKVRAILGRDEPLSGKTDREVMDLALHQDKADMTGRSDDYVRGAFEARASMASATRADAIDAVRIVAAAGAGRQDAKPSALRLAVERRAREQAEALTRPVGGA